MGNKKMSGRRKKRTFSGIVAKQKIHDGGANDLVDSQPNNSDLNTSASKKKLSAVVTDTDRSAECITEGFILIDVDMLRDYLSRTAVCAECLYCVA